MKLNYLKTMIIAAVLSFSAVSSANDLVVEEEEFPYLRCNATGWDANEATKLAPTDDPDIYVLEYSVTQEWMVSGFDQCILTITDSPDGWGTSQQSIGSASTTPIEVPGTWNLDEESSAYASVSYPALGEYRATVDLSEMTVSFEAVDATPPPAEDVYYYLRCNTTGWNVGPNNRLVLDGPTGHYTLDYAVAMPWSAWGDTCTLTETNEEDGWGTTQVQWGIAPGSSGLVIPEDGEVSAAMIEGGQYFRVTYPAAGDYVAEFDPMTDTLTLGVPGEDPIDWGLNGEVEDLGNGRVRITYNFETENQLEDWLPVDSEETNISIVDGRLVIGGSTMVGFALLTRGLRVDSMQFEVELLAGSQVTTYLGAEWDGARYPAIGYGLAHYSGGRGYSENGVRTGLGGTRTVTNHVYQWDILAEADGITWAIDDEVMSIPLSYSDDATKSLAIGAYSSTAAFDNIVIEAELAPLP